MGAVKLRNPKQIQSTNAQMTETRNGIKTRDKFNRFWNFEFRSFDIVSNFTPTWCMDAGHHEHTTGPANTGQEPGLL
jgi:hypothetical protein